MKNKKQIIFIAGPNGAGKTTSAYLLLPEFFGTNEFVNADEIARGLSPLNPDSMVIRAGKLMLKRIKELVANNKSFGIETTLSGLTYRPFILDAKLKGYSIGLIFLYLNSVSLAKERVNYRVIHGGHNIPQEVIKRRYERGLKNLIHTYLPIIDWAYVFDNSSQNSCGPSPIYFSYKDSQSSIINRNLWEAINEYKK